MTGNPVLSIVNENHQINLEHSGCCRARSIGFDHTVHMCGRYRLSRRKEILEEQFAALSDDAEWSPRYNIAPTQFVPVVRQNSKTASRELALTRWGLVPSWAKDSSKAAAMINARSETAASKPAFSDALKFRRCLIPADGFYEWSRHEAACVIVRRAPLDRTCHPIGSTLRGMAIR